MTSILDAAREAARNKATGQFGEQQLGDPGADLLAEPGLPQLCLDMIWEAMSRHQLCDGPAPASVGEWQARVGDDLPGLSEGQRRWFTDQVMRYADAWMSCQAVLNNPAGATWAAINTHIPRGLQARLPRKQFTVADDSNLGLDPLTGETVGSVLVRSGSNAEWVAALAECCSDEIASLTIRARAASDKKLPRQRTFTHPDPWTEYVSNPPF